MDDMTESLEQWLEEWYAAAYRTACLVLRDPIAAEDAVQEAFLRVWRFRSSIPSGDGRKAWLYRVVVNACMSRGRSEGRHSSRAANLELSPELASTAPQPDELAEQSELSTLVGLALADLPENLRVPLVLRFYAGLSEREIATAIQRRPGTVKSRLHAGRRRLAADPRLAGWVAQLEGAAQLLALRRRLTSPTRRSARGSPRQRSSTTCPRTAPTGSWPLLRNRCGRRARSPPWGAAGRWPAAYGGCRASRTLGWWRRRCSSWRRWAQPTWLVAAAGRRRARIVR